MFLSRKPKLCLKTGLFPCSIMELGTVAFWAFLWLSASGIRWFLQKCGRGKCTWALKPDTLKSEASRCVRDYFQTSVYWQHRDVQKRTKAL